MRDIINKLKQLEESHTEPSGPQVGDEFGLSFSDDLEISTTITDVLEDGIVVEMDDDAIAHLTENGAHLYDGEITETKAQKGLDGKRCWKGYRRMGTKMKGGKRVDNCVKVGEGIEEVNEAMVSLDQARDYFFNKHDFADENIQGEYDNIANKMSPEDAETLKKELEEFYPDVTFEGVEEASIDIDRVADRNKPWLKVALLIDDEVKKISLKSDEGIELSNDLNALSTAIQEAGPEGTPKVNDPMIIKAIKAYSDAGKFKSDPKQILKVVNTAVTNWEQGADFDRSAIKDPNPEPEMEKESSEVDRIRQLSGLQTEGHGPEVDGFLEKLAAMDDDQEKYETAEKAYAGKFGPKIQQAIHDMYNEAKKSVGDMDDIMDDVLDMIEKDYGTKEDIDVDEAEYQGRKVSLGKPTRGDVKKFKVYVKNPKGNVVKVNFGDPNMKIKKSNPARRRSFRARHNCANPGPRHKARYWSCRKW